MPCDPPPDRGALQAACVPARAAQGGLTLLRYFISTSSSSYTEPGTAFQIVYAQGQITCSRATDKVAITGQTGLLAFKP